MSKSEHPVANGGKDHVKHNDKRSKLTFDELLAKYQKDNEAKRASRSNKVKSSRLPPKHNSGNWNRQGKSFHAATTYSPFEPSMLVSYAPYPTSDHPHSSWGCSDSWTHTPSYFRPYHVEYAAPRQPSHARQSYVRSDRFEYKDRSGAQNKKKVVKQVYRVKRDGRKDKSSDLNSVNEESINVFSTSATNGKEREKPFVDPPSAKFERKEVKRSVNKRGALQSKTKAKSSHPLGLSNWQKKKLQKLSAQELKMKGITWILKGSIRTHTGDDQAKGATQLKEKKRYEKRYSKLKFAPNHQSHWSLPSPFALQMLHMPMFWNSSLDMLDYTSYSYFGPWVPHGSSLYHRGLSPKYYAY
jgi:hypothetical protein